MTCEVRTYSGLHITVGINPEFGQPGVMNMVLSIRERFGNIEEIRAKVRRISLICGNTKVNNKLERTFKLKHRDGVVHEVRLLVHYKLDGFNVTAIEASQV